MEHRVFIYDAYVRNGDSVVVAQRLFRRHFNVGRHGPVPTRKTIVKWVQQFRATGSVIKKSAGAQRTVRTEDNIERVRAAVLRSPQRSARRHSLELHLGRESVRRILKDIHFHAYKMVGVQQLLGTDYAQREDFAVRMQVLLHDEPDALIFMSDEAHFHLNGFVNRQNFRYWAHDNPRELHERPLHSPRVTVWCAMSRCYVIGPYFFEEDGVTVTVNSIRYTHMINTFLRPELQMLNLEQDVWFQQDGATAHTARISMNALRRLFPGHLISRLGDVPWPPRSPDLSMCDFFLWGFLKERVYRDKPRTLDELKRAIRREVQQINQETLERVWGSFTCRLENCIRANGHHLKDIIFN
mgnify:CR=1 FL=1